MPVKAASARRIMLVVVRSLARQPRDYSFQAESQGQKGRFALCSFRSFKDEKMTVLNALDLEKISTKGFAEVLSRFDIDKTLVVIDGENHNLELSARNLPQRQGAARRRRQRLRHHEIPHTSSD